MDKKEMDFVVAPNQAKPANPAKKRKLNHSAFLVVTVGLIVLAIFVIRPAILGYGVYQRAEASNLTVQDYAQSMQQLNRDLEVTKTNLSSYSTFTGALIAQIDQKSDEIIECKVELERIKLNVEAVQKQVAEKETEVATVKSETEKTIVQEVTEKTAALGQEKAACESSLTSKETEVGQVQAKYDLLVKNTAKSICCKVKVDNPQINFYEVVDNKISCLEQGTNQLSC